jgi:glutamine synthetase
MSQSTSQSTTDATDMLQQLRDRGVRFLLLQFTDLLGVNKAVEVSLNQIPQALAEGVLFDGSALEGFARTVEADALLVPDLSTFRIFPWTTDGARADGEATAPGAVARLICDIRYPDGRLFEGCPRTALKRQIELTARAGYQTKVSCEVEFFLFEQGERGEATTNTLDAGSYFDLMLSDRGDRARRVIAATLEDLDLDPASLHHEVARGQHEIALMAADPLTMADNLVTFRFVVRTIARQHGLVATLMPKPTYGRSGSGLHTHLTLLTTDGRNAFFDQKGLEQLSDIGRWYIGGLLRHARGYCAVTNPLVNSYKRLVTGFEAPVNVAWSTQNVSPLIRVPADRGDGTRCENRLPDPSANPYLALAVQLAAGLDGVTEHLDPGDPINKNIARMSYRERRRYRIDELPRDLHEALDYLEKDRVIRDALGEHIYERYVDAKREEWHDFIEQVTEWEVGRYLAQY